VSRGHHNIRVIKRPILKPSGHQTTYMTDVREQISAYAVSNFPEALILKLSRVCREASHDELWAELGGFSL